MNVIMSPAATKSYFADVTAPGARALESPTLWIAMTRTGVGGRQCREYTVTDEAGGTLLTARAFVWDWAPTPRVISPVVGLSRRQRRTKAARTLWLGT